MAPTLLTHPGAFRDPSPGVSWTVCLVVVASEPIEPGHRDDGSPRLVRGLEIDDGGDAPVVIAGRVVERLSHAPLTREPFDREHGAAAGISSREDFVVVAPVRVEGVGPPFGRESAVCIEFAEVVVPVEGRQLHTTEQGVCARARGMRAHSS
jgi:hypothetical protein